MVGVSGMTNSISRQDCPIRTPFGVLQATWTAAGLASFRFMASNPVPDLTKPDIDPPPRSGQLKRAAAGYLDSGVFEFAFESLDLSGLPEFSVTVLRLCHQIPPGQTRTYGQVANQAGSPAAARAVGIVMAKNRWPILIPCHRVIGSSGKLTGYSGAGGIETKKRLIEFERVLLGLDLF